MKILTEADLRSALLLEDVKTYHVSSDIFVTPSAKEYLRDRGIELVAGSEACRKTMTRTPVPDQGNHTYVDAVTGEGYAKKPEEMTHLRGNLLVPKTHPNIAFRGKLDTLQALIIEIQAKVYDKGCLTLVEDLGGILDCTRKILAAEVKDELLKPMDILGYDDIKLREVSHNVKTALGMDHPIPDYTMGEVAAKLNLLRTQIRETELSAASAFMKDEGITRPDILKQLNRLSSGAYILFCRWLAGYYKGGKA